MSHERIWAIYWLKTGRSEMFVVLFNRYEDAAVLSVCDYIWRWSGSRMVTLNKIALYNRSECRRTRWTLRWTGYKTTKPFCADCSVGFLFWNPWSSALFDSTPRYPTFPNGLQNLVQMMQLQAFRLVWGLCTDTERHLGASTPSGRFLRWR